MFTLCLGNAKKELNFVSIPQNPLGGFVYFNMSSNDMTEFVDEGVRLIDEECEKIDISNNIVLFTAETSTLAMAHMLRKLYGYEVQVMTKKRRPDGRESIFEDYCAITSTVSSTLYFDGNYSTNKKIVFFDNVCTTGETVKAAAKLLCQLGLKIHTAIVLFTESEENKKLTEITVSNDYKIPLISFGHLPIINLEHSKIKPQFIFQSETSLPTYDYGKIRLAVFTSHTKKDAIVAYNSTSNNILVRVHDACATSELFHSEKCDCREQLEESLKRISTEKGMVIYLPQEGRGIGLANKLSAYNLQETKGLNTVEANLALGFPQDIRNYIAVRDILKHFNISSIRLLSNNPRKKQELENIGVTVSEMVPSIIQTKSSLCRKYLTDKAVLMDHKLQIIKFYNPEDEYGFLSNFYVYSTVPPYSSEHIYQSQKFEDKNLSKEILESKTPKEAFELSRKYFLLIRDDWEEKKILAMKEALIQKFSNITLKQKLLETGNAILVEDSPNDTFWGLPNNNLGRLLMELRDILKNE